VLPQTGRRTAIATQRGEMGEGVHAATHPEASWDVCGAEAIPLALAARVREDSAAPRLRWVHSRRRGPGETPQYPRARGGCHSRRWCATLPALIQRHAAGVPRGVPTRCSTPTACCLLRVPLPRRRSASGSSLLRSTHRWYEAPMMSSAHALCRASHPLVKEGPL